MSIGIIKTGGCGLPCALAVLLAMAGPAQAGTVEAIGPDGRRLARVEAEEWCILWNHSVAGFEVRDCYRLEAGRMILARSHQPDFAAGLGHVPGRGEQRSDGAGGYRIEGIDEIVPGNCYRLRVGSPKVDHRIVAGDVQISLTALAAGESIAIRAHDAESKGIRAC